MVINNIISKIKNYFELTPELTSTERELVRNHLLRLQVPVEYAMQGMQSITENNYSPKNK